MLLTTEGIILKHIKATGGRNMIQIFTKEYGKISAGAGNKLKNSRSGSALATRPFTHGRYGLFKNRIWWNYSSGEVINSHFSIGENLNRYVSSSYIMELTEKVLPEELPEPEIFNLLAEFLCSADKREDHFLTLILAFEINLLNIEGLTPVTKNCSCCGEGSPSVFSIPDGGMICQDCLEKKVDEETGSLIYKTDFDIVSIIDFFSNNPIKAFDNIALKDNEASELQKIIRDYIGYHLGIGKLKSEAMLESPK